MRNVRVKTGCKMNFVRIVSVRTGSSMCLVRNVSVKTEFKNSSKKLKLKFS